MTDLRAVPRPQHPILELEGVAKSFGPRAVLRGVDLSLAPGRIVALTGSNGSGKSTLLRCIAGLARCSGRLLVDGAPAGSRDARCTIGYLPQQVLLDDLATVEETVRLFARLRGASLDPDWLPASFLPPPGAFIGSLSGGQRQRLGLATALVGAPRLLLLDEPTANLDSAGRAVVATILRALRDAGGSALVASPHAPTEDGLEALLDEVVLLEDGVVAPRVAPQPNRLDMRLAPLAVTPAEEMAV